MYTNYYQPSQTQFHPQARPNQFGLKGRPVSSIEEVKATSIDFDGTVFYFPDLANQRIYTKQINMDGTSTLQLYELKEIPVEPIPYITRQEFEETINQLRNLLTPAAPAVEPAPAPEYKF